MKKAIITAITVVVVAVLVAVAVYVTKKPHTVSDFSIYPCRFDRATSLSIDNANGRMVLAQSKPGEWRIESPYHEQIAREPHTALMQFLMARMFIDAQSDLSETEKSRLQKPDATKVTFYNGDQILCGFELGQGYKLPTVDAERRWIFPEGSQTAYRTFVHLMDFGVLFEQPFGAWRERMMIQVPAVQFRQIELTAPGERLVLARVPDGSVQDYQLISAMQNGTPLDVSNFEIDNMRVATLIDLATPLIIDDWAENVDDTAFNYAGRLTIRTQTGDQYMEIGPEIAKDKYPQWAYLGEGARFVRQASGRIGVVSAARLMGLFPSLNDLRAKQVWHVDTERLSAIEIRVGQNCLRYLPVSKEQWAGLPCPGISENPLAGETPQNLDMKALAQFAMTLQKLQAVRYVDSKEMTDNGSTLEPPQAELLLYLDLNSEPAYTLQLSQSVKQLYRYAKVRTIADDGIQDGPVFVLSENMVRLLLSDMREHAVQ